MEIVSSTEINDDNIKHEASLYELSFAAFPKKKPYIEYTFRICWNMNQTIRKKESAT